VPAAFVIDWTIPAQTIGARCKKLSPQTLERIAKGIERFGEEAAFIASVYGTGTNKSIERPLGAITTSGGHHGLALSPFLVQYYGRKDASSSINSPVPTLTGAPRHALVIPPPVQSSFIVEYYSKGRIRNLCEPLGGLTTKERFGLVINSGSADQTPSIDRWGYRMLSVTETAGAMGFPCTRLGASKDYAIVGSNAMKHRLVGQSVCPPVKRAIVERLVDLLSSQI
jgi:DNA (cytosine-5)-methyltransferase 1